ncbi:MAG: 50S ribosomal protein L9, partial [Actinomycetota bacterium]|nr:50S ribosomal protein L9 [Actinomycetota bacterium]
PPVRLRVGMDVILLKDVDKVGLRSEVVNVSRGFMRNYLQPRRLAEPATPARIAELEKLEAQRARHEARSFEHAQEIAETLRKTVLRFEVNAGPRGTLFGSVTPTDIADELWRTRKIRVDRRKIHLSDPIKRVGRYEVPIDVFQDVRVDVKTLVVPEGGELPSEDELAAWEAEEAAEAGVGAAAAPTGSPEAAELAGEPGEADDEGEATAGEPDAEWPKPSEIGDSAAARQERETAREPELS